MIDHGETERGTERRLLTIQPRGDALIVCARNDSDPRWDVDGTVPCVVLRHRARRGPIALSAGAGSATRMSLTQHVVATGGPATELIVLTAGGLRACGGVSRTVRSRSSNRV